MTFDAAQAARELNDLVAQRCLAVFLKDNEKSGRDTTQHTDEDWKRSTAALIAAFNVEAVALAARAFAACGRPTEGAMPEKPRDYAAELRAIMDALAESVAEASDEDILAEAREAGEDPARTAARVRAVLRRAVNHADAS